MLEIYFFLKLFNLYKKYDNATKTVRFKGSTSAVSSGTSGKHVNILKATKLIRQVNNKHRELTFAKNVNF